MPAVMVDGAELRAPARSGSNGRATSHPQERPREAATSIGAFLATPAADDWSRVGVRRRSPARARAFPTINAHLMRCIA